MKPREEKRGEEKRRSGEGEEEKRIENMQEGTNKEQKEENNMEVDTPILVKNVKGTGVDIQLKGKCLHTVIENQQYKRHKEVQLQMTRIISRENEKNQLNKDVSYQMCEKGSIRKEWCTNLIEFYIEWRKRRKDTVQKEGYREVEGQREIVMR